MNCIHLRITFALAGVALLFWQASIWPREVHLDRQGNTNELDGVWTQVSYEVEGRLTSLLPAPFTKQTPKGGPPGFFLATFNKGTLETGPDNPVVPPNRSTYILNPGNKEGWMDIIPLDKDGKQMANEKREAIYLVKDDYLIMCVGVVRPDRFTTAAAAKTTALGVFRRGKQK